ncbi:MAG TPA: hypothetical protein VFD82_13700 [Planctomycetota bacterium]|nr:hypothetical protein [Planctomycetota bacterium]
MLLEVNPTGLRLARCCDGGRANLYIVRDERGRVTIEWRKGSDRVVDVRCCLRCGMPLRIEKVAVEK